MLQNQEAKLGRHKTTRRLVLYNVSGRRVAENFQPWRVRRKIDKTKPPKSLTP